MDGITRSKSISPAHITQTDFKNWSNQNMYRTSYKDMQQKSPVSEKKYAIPGYSGHVPGSSSDSPYAKRFTLISKERFSREGSSMEQKNCISPQRHSSVSPSSFNCSRFGGGLEDNYQTISHFHGKSTIPEHHPNYNTKDSSTSYKATFKDQESLRPNLFRSSNINTWKKTHSISCSKFKASGFVQNNSLFDGHGWTPISKLHGDMSFSEYRKRFSGNQFYPSPLQPKDRRLKRKKLVY